MNSIQIGATFAKGLFPYVGPAGATGLRLFFASLMLLVLFKPWRTLYSRNQLALIGAYGLALGIMNLSFYFALARIPLGITVAVEFIGPLGLALLFSRRRLDWLWVALAAFGIILILPLQPYSSELDPIGILLAALAGLAWAFYIFFGQRAGNAAHGGQVVALGMSVASALVVPIALFEAGSSMFLPEIVPTALAVAALSSAVPYTLEMISLKSMPTTVFGVFMSFEPVIASIAAFALLNEQLTLVQCAAIALIVAASVGSTLFAAATK